jgi:hypothetical protein
MAIGIPSVGITGGTQVIGLDPLTREHIGSDRITMASNSLQAIGRGIMGVLNMITAGTAITTGIITRTTITTSLAFALAGEAISRRFAGQCKRYLSS